jgi:hypothetical protein
LENLRPLLEVERVPGQEVVVILTGGVHEASVAPSPVMPE